MLELQEKQNEFEVKEEGLHSQKLFFLIKLEKCNKCHFIEETGIKFSLNCDKCIQEALEGSGFNITIKQLDPVQYKIIRRETPVCDRNKELKNDPKKEKKPYSEKRKMYEEWIIDQILSGNHNIIDAAQNGSLFSPEIKNAFVDVAFKTLEKKNIIKRDTMTGKYYVVDKKSKNEEKEIQWRYYVSYVLIDNTTIQNTNKMFKTLEEALAFVKSQNLMNYYIRRSETL